MGEYKKKKAKTEHICSKCGNKIAKGEEYYCEEQFLASLHRLLNKFCKNCYQKYNNSLLNLK